jgi:hypothetical protein
MHNCKETRNRLIEQALEKTPDQSEPLLAELEHCPDCREEFASLRSVLRLADQAMESALPAEGFWSGYHERLRQNLESASESAVSSHSRHLQTEPGLRTWLRKLVTASVPVPVPLAAVLVVLFGLSLTFAMNSRSSSKGARLPDSPSVVTKIVEVPVIQERTITRVVYRENPRHSSRDTVRLERAVRNTSIATAGQNKITEDTLISLVGFKPTSDPKLTIIKGSYRDEK